jgi:hypothetical protein
MTLRNNEVVLEKHHSMKPPKHSTAEINSENDYIFFSLIGDVRAVYVTRHTRPETQATSARGLVAWLLCVLDNTHVVDFCSQNFIRTCPSHKIHIWRNPSPSLPHTLTIEAKTDVSS